MRLMSVRALFGASILLLCIGSGGTPPFAQNNWLGTIPKEEVGCIRSQGKIETIDLGKLLRDNAKAAGVVEVGYPILTGTNPTENSDGTTDLAACALYKGSVHATSGFQLRLLPASPGAFALCEGTDTKACSDSVLTWIRAKSPQFNALPRLIPLFGYSTDKLDATNQAVNSLISQTFPISGDETASKVPEPATDLDNSCMVSLRNRGNQDLC